jgi:MFS family permease
VTAPQAGALAADEGHPRRWYALSVLCLALGMVALDNTILNVAIPNIAGQLHADESHLQWISTSYGLVLAGLLLPLAVVGDRQGRKGLLIIGLLLFGAASGVAALARTPVELALCRGAMGVGGACTMPATLSLLGNLFNDAERGVAIAIWSATAGLASAAGPIVGGLLLHTFWWGSVFLVNLPVAAAGVVCALLIVPRSRDRASPPLDLVSSLAWWVALTCALVAIIEGPVRGWTSPIVLGAGALALAVFALFCSNERTSTRPLVGMAAALDGRLQGGVATMSAMFFAVFGVQFVVTQWLQGPRRHSALFAGMCFVPSAIANLAAALMNPRWTRRWGHAPVAAAGMVVMTAGALATTAAVATSAVGAVPVGVLLLGAGVGIASPSGAELIMSSVPAERAGSAAGVNETVIEASGALGVAALGTVLAAGVGYAWPLPLAAVATAVAAVVVLRCARRPPAPPPAR